MKAGLYTVSCSGLWYDGPALSMEDFIAWAKERGYDGWFCYEFCHPCLDERHEPAGIERVDEQVGMATEYMKRVIAEHGTAREATPPVSRLWGGDEPDVPNWRITGMPIA
jgi:hypothetical protein